MSNLRILTILLVAATGLSAQEGTHWVNLQGGYVTQDHSAIKDSGALGLGLGTWVSDRFGLELSGLGLRLKDTATGTSASEKHEFVSGLLNLNPGGQAWYPYLRAGLGATQVPDPFSGKQETTTRLNLHAGLGVQGAGGLQPPRPLVLTAKHRQHDQRPHQRSKEPDAPRRQIFCCRPRWPAHALPFVAGELFPHRFERQWLHEEAVAGTRWDQAI